MSPRRADARIARHPLWPHRLRRLRVEPPLPHRATPAAAQPGGVRRLVGYLIATQFFEERGNPDQGQRVFEKKRCGVCHDYPETGAPARTMMAGRMTSYGLVAALWKHGPRMLGLMQRYNSPGPASKAPRWRTFPPTFTDSSSNGGHLLNVNTVHCPQRAASEPCHRPLWANCAGSHFALRVHLVGSLPRLVRGRPSHSIS